MAAPMKRQETSTGLSTWTLQRYARFIPYTENPDGSGEQKIIQNITGKWKYFSPASETGLTISLQEEHTLVISNGSTILESCFLRNATNFLKAFSKTDSILFVQKLKNETRRFRVQFLSDQNKTSNDVCSSCVQVLSLLIPVKRMERNRDGPDATDVSSNRLLSGDVSLAELSQVLTHDLPADLPAAYRQPDTQASGDELSALIRLCLTDPTFPSFVEAVDKELQSLTTG